MLGFLPGQHHLRLNHSHMPYSHVSLGTQPNLEGIPPTHTKGRRLGQCHQFFLISPTGPSRICAQQVLGKAALALPREPSPTGLSRPRKFLFASDLSEIGTFQTFCWDARNFFPPCLPLLLLCFGGPCVGLGEGQGS
jgi:hypothetical protein